jgi:dihydrofolate reductase
MGIGAVGFGLLIDSIGYPAGFALTAAVLTTVLVTAWRARRAATSTAHGMNDKENQMGRVLLSMSVSLDGFAAGPDVTVEHPMGRGGERLHEWLFHDGADRAVAADGVSPVGVDTEQAQELSTTTGAVVIGKRTFGIGVGLWQDTPFPVPSFVITHEPHEQMAMKSAAFTFVTGGIEDALRQAQHAAGDKNVLIMGGASIAQQFVQSRLVDEIRLQLVPVLLGAGTRLFDHLATDHIELERTMVMESPRVTHLRFQVMSTRTPQSPSSLISTARPSKTAPTIATRARIVPTPR